MGRSKEEQIDVGLGRELKNVFWSGGDLGAPEISGGASSGEAI